MKEIGNLKKIMISLDIFAKEISIPNFQAKLLLKRHPIVLEIQLI